MMHTSPCILEEQRGWQIIYQIMVWTGWDIKGHPIPAPLWRTGMPLADQMVPAAHLTLPGGPGRCGTPLPTAKACSASSLSRAHQPRPLRLRHCRAGGACGPAEPPIRAGRGEHPSRRNPGPAAGDATRLETPVPRDPSAPPRALTAGTPRTPPGPERPPAAAPCPLRPGRALGTGTESGRRRGTGGGKGEDRQGKVGYGVGAAGGGRAGGAGGGSPSALRTGGCGTGGPGGESGARGHGQPAPPRAGRSPGRSLPGAARFAPGLRKAGSWAVTTQKG